MAETIGWRRPTYANKGEAMDWILFCKALILGVVEGLTEFLPVSSTGHLIVAGSVLNFTNAQAKTFDVVIQFGAILAIVWEYRRKIGSVVAGLPTQPKARRFALNVIIATIPAVVLGLLFEKHIKAVLFAPGFKADQVRGIDLYFSCIFDDQDTLVFRDQVGHRVE